MVSKTIGEDYLRIFDSLDINELSSRRISVFVLEEFFGKVMSEVANERLDMDLAIQRMNLTTQWGQMLAWLGHNPADDKADEYSQKIRMLKQIRNEVAHDYFKGVNTDRLIEVREIAEEWRSWVLDRSESIESNISQRTYIEAKIQHNLDTAKNIIENLRSMNLSEEEKYDVDDWEIPYDICRQRFNQLEGDKSREIRKDLVELLMMSYNVRIKLAELRNEIHLKNTE